MFRHIEHTVLHDLVNQTFQQAQDGGDLYRTHFLIHGQGTSLAGQAFHQSRSAMLKIGHISAGDLVIDTNGVVGKLIKCWQKVDSPEIILELDTYRCVNNDAKIHSMTQRRPRGTLTSRGRG